MAKIAKTRWHDPIVEALHERRERHARKFNYDLKAIFEDWKRRQEESDRDVVSLPPKRIDKAEKEDAA